ncbi:helix-turn-helix domain-containing protein [Dryocola sp. BD613]|uniref:helix-turn-helix domain-containing protein n=1 Tax=Dryocola sp. BD613 TaxID=3133272 RepID=UPI003F4FB194
MKKDMDCQNIVLVSCNLYALMGLESLINQCTESVKLTASVNHYTDLASLLSTQRIDIVILIHCNQAMAGMNWFRYITELKIKFPHLFLCMYSSHTTILSPVRDYSDAFFCFDESVESWQKHFSQLLESAKKAPKALNKKLSLTALEWLILKEIQKGRRNQRIAEKTHLTYRKVSALKSRAKRKLGLKNNTELLLFLTN